MATVISLVGRTKAGKSTLGMKLARYLRTEHIEASEIINQLLDHRPVEELVKLTLEKSKENPYWFGNELNLLTKEAMDKKGREVVVISGIRELPTIEALKKNFDYYGFEVVAPLPVRVARAFDTGKYKTYDQFIRGEIMELDIGIAEVEDDAPYSVPTSPHTNPDRIIRAAVKVLRKAGATLR